MPAPTGFTDVLWVGVAAVRPLTGAGQSGMRLGGGSRSTSPYLSVARHAFVDCRFEGDGAASSFGMEKVA